MGLVLAGCDRQPDDPTRAAGAAPAEVRLGYFPNLTHAQAVLGVASGEFAQAIAPAELTTRTFNAGPSLIEALFAGEIDVAYVGPGPALSAYNQSRGEGIRVIAGAANNGVVIVARPDAGIHTLQDLKDKRIATPQHGNTQDISARHYLTALLGQTSADNVMPVANTEQSALMASGQIDAAWAPEPWASRLIHDNNAVVIAEEKDLWPNGRFGLTYVVTTPEFLAAHPDVIESLLAVHTSWTHRLQTEPQRYVIDLSDALTALSGKPLPPEVLTSALRRVTFVNEPDEATFAAYADWSADLGFARQRADITSLIDRSALQRVANASLTTAPATSRPAPEGGTP